MPHWCDQGADSGASVPVLCGNDSDLLGVHHWQTLVSGNFKALSEVRACDACASQAEVCIDAAAQLVHGTAIPG